MSTRQAPLPSGHRSTDMKERRRQRSPGEPGSNTGSVLSISLLLLSVAACDTGESSLAIEHGRGGEQCGSADSGPTPTPDAAETPSPEESPDYDAGPPPTGNANLIFRSGFENGVTLSHRGDGQESYLHGDDQGFDWDDLDHFFNYVRTGAVDNTVVTEMTTDMAHGGSRSLYQAQHVIDNESQNRLQFFGRDDGEIGSNVFVRRWIWFPDDLSEKMPARWDGFSVGGIREGSEYSVPLYITQGQDGLYWSMNGINYTAGNRWSDWINPANGGWEVRDLDVPVPVGRWFKLETYYERHATNGTVKVWLDGELLFDVQNVRTKGPGTHWFSKISDIDAILHGSEDGLPIYLYVDDIEVWDGIP